MEKGKSIAGQFEFDESDLINGTRDAISSAIDLIALGDEKRSEHKSITESVSLMEGGRLQKNIKERKQNKALKLVSIITVVIAVCLIGLWFVKRSFALAIIKAPGSAWNNAIKSIKTIDELQSYWPGIQSDWASRHINITWDTFVSVFKKNHPYGGTVMVDALLKETVKASYSTWTVLIGIVLAIGGALLFKKSIDNDQYYANEKKNIITMVNLTCKGLGLEDHYGLSETMNDQELLKAFDTLMVEVKKRKQTINEQYNETEKQIEGNLEKLLSFLPERYRNDTALRIMKDLIDSYQAENIKELIKETDEALKRRQEERDLQAYRNKQLAYQAEQNRLLQQQVYEQQKAMDDAKRAQEKAERDAHKAEMKRLSNYNYYKNKYDTENRNYLNALATGRTQDAAHLKAMADSYYAEMMKYK